MDNTEKFTHISLCTGYAGIDIGLKRVIKNFRTIAYSEIEAYAVANLVSKIEAGFLDAAPIWSNIKTFPWKEFYNKVDIITGGFPCQPFSQAGNRKADNDTRHLFPYIKRGIELVRPAFVFLENVEGIVSCKLGKESTDRKGTPVLLHVLRELERMDYKATAGIFSASEVGAPHQRKRVFILANSNSKGKNTKYKHFIYKNRGNLPRDRDTLSEIKNSSNFNIGASNSISEHWPAKRGSSQYIWEPPRTINADKQKLKCNSSSKVESAVGRNTDGCSYRMDYDQLCESVCSRTDELRLLGNGVVPSTAEKAFRTLYERLTN